MDAPSRLRWPAALQPGDLVAAVAPAGPPSPHLVEQGVALFESWGLRVRLGESVFAGHDLGFLAAGDDARAGDVEAALTDPDVAAVAAVRGGWGCQRVLDRIDWPAVEGHAKPLVGFSDVTALHTAVRQRCALVTYYGPSLAGHAERLGDAGVASLRAALWGQPGEPLAGEPLSPGQATGPLVGGNLTVLAALCGTRWQLDARDAVVLLEDIDERPYRLDRSLTQMRQAGALHGAVALACDDFPCCIEPPDRGPSATARAVLRAHARELGVPAVWGLPVGHGRGQRTVALGAPARLDGDAGTLSVAGREGSPQPGAPAAR